MKHRKDTPAEIEAALSYISPFCTRDVWRDIGFAIHSWNDGPTGLKIWKNWSMSHNCQEYEPGSCEENWKGFVQTEDGIKMGTLIKMATDNGYDNSGRPKEDSAPVEIPEAPPEPKPKAYIWRSESVARAEYAKLEKARDNAEALEYLRENYGVDPKSFYEDWRVVREFTRDGKRKGPGLLYLGETPDGKIGVKYRSFDRPIEKQDGSRKRDQCFFYKADKKFGPTALIHIDDHAPLVIVGGEEKYALARQHGYSVLALQTGEGSLPECWRKWIIEHQDAFPHIVFANDCDEAGGAANAKHADSLIAAGFPPEKIRIIEWPEGMGDGYDLNDAAKDGMDVDGLLANAPVYVPDPEAYGNRALTLEQFMAVSRPPLKYVIEGFLPERGKMTISAEAKGYKTMLLLELGMCCAMGNTQYLNFTFNDPAPCIVVQPELSDQLMEARMKWIQATAPDWVNMTRVSKNLHILETVRGRPALWKDHPRSKKSREELDREIVKTKAKLLLVDSLYMVMAGMDENESEEMTIALDYFGDLANRHGVAIIITHHFNKGGKTRGSSVFQGWGETDLTMSRLDDEKDIMAVDVLMRCAWPKGFTAYWRTPTEHTAWFEHLEGFQPEKKGRGRPKATHLSPDIVRMVLQTKGPLEEDHLCRLITEAASCSQSTAYDVMAFAKREGMVLRCGKKYSLKS